MPPPPPPATPAADGGRHGPAAGSPADAGYPPEPWRLRGDLHASLWRVPPDRLPAWPLPAGVRPLAVGRRRTLLTFWVDYRPGGVLAYRELLVALAVRHRRGLAATAVEVWVDSAPSRAGGRALWGIPKELGALVLDSAGPDGRRGGDGDGGGGTLRARLSTASGGSVRYAYRELLPLPGRLPVRARLVQRRQDGQVCPVPLRLAGSPAVGTARLRTGPHGPLGYLDGLRPRLSGALRDFRFVVGTEDGAAATAPPPRRG